MPLLTIILSTILVVTISVSTALSIESHPQSPIVVSVPQLQDPGMTPPSGGGGQPGGGGDYEYNPKLPGPSPKTLNRKIPRNSTTTRWKDTDGTEGGPVIDNGGRIFGQKCRQATLLGSGNTGSSILQAACIADGRWWQTTLNLNQCIGIRGRQLVFEESGNYDRTCRPCGIDADTATSHVVLPCTCLSNQDGAPSFTELLLAGHDDAGIKSVDGRLVCGGHEGTKSPNF